MICGSADIRTRANDKKQIRVLNRTLTWRATRIEYEADQRHAAALIDKNLTSKDRPVSTSGEDMNDDTRKLFLETQEEIKSYRGHAARGTYLSMNRPDEPCRSPQQGINAAT